MRRAVRRAAIEIALHCFGHCRQIFACAIGLQPTVKRVGEFLDAPCRNHFQQVQDILASVGVPFTLNDRLVRGLDYYTRTAFEFTHGNLGAQNAILGGGRYDGLSESLGGPAAPGIGFAIGAALATVALPPPNAILLTPDPSNPYSAFVLHSSSMIGCMRSARNRWALRVSGAAESAGKSAN